MKKLAFSLIGLFILSLGIYSCTKEPNENNSIVKKNSVQNNQDIFIASINVKMQGIIAILKNKNIDPGEFLKTIQLTGNQLQYTEYCNGLGLSNIESEEIEASITEIGFILKELDLQYFNNRLIILQDPPLFNCRDMAGYQSCLEKTQRTLNQSRERLIRVTVVVIAQILYTDGAGLFWTTSGWLNEYKNYLDDENNYHDDTKDCKRVYCE